MAERFLEDEEVPPARPLDEGSELRAILGGILCRVLDRVIGGCKMWWTANLLYNNK